MNIDPSDKYRPLSPPVIAALQEIVGNSQVLWQDRDKMAEFSHDEIPGTHYRSFPEAVVFPATAAEIVALVKLANRERIPLTPRGAGSGLSGGAVPIYGGIVISTKRLNRILEIDSANMMITVEPGVVANDLNEQLKPYGLFYAGYPMSMETCYLGGNVAENAGGGKAIKYGVTARYVLGLEVVLPNGTLVELGGKLNKDVTGYNLVQLMVGSEGTLGIVTKIILKLLPRPQFQADLLCLFRSSKEAIAAVPKILTESGVLPTSLEFMERSGFLAACEYLNVSFPTQDCEAMLLISVDGFEQEQVEKDYDKIGTYCQHAGASEIYVADNNVDSERLWKIRRAIPEAFSLGSKLQSGEDVVVPPSMIPMLAEAFQQIAEKFEVAIPCYGHAGDGNLHARITPPPEWDEEKWRQVLPCILHEVYAVVKKAGGRISGEHGIGHKRKDYLKCVVSSEYLELLRTIKLALDPNNIMNPGKIFDC